MAANDTPCQDHEEQIQSNTRKIAEVQTELKFKEKRIDDLYLKMEKVESKIDIMNENINQLVLQSNKDDTELELRLKAIETELAVQKEITTQNNNRLSTLLAVVGVGLTIITILINVYFNLIH
jgi:chromosome segregation ATPase